MDIKTDSNKSWDILVISGKAENVQMLSSFIIDRSSGLEEKDGEARVYFDRGLKDLIIEFIDTLPSKFMCECRWGTEEYQDWNRNWKKFFTPIFIKDKIAIKPEWDDTKYGLDHSIRIRPGMAFGTGHHETTTLMIEQLIATIKDGDRVLDLGTGSGILAIAAKILGAGSVEAVENDIGCRENFLDNMILNGINSIEFTHGDVLDLDSYSYDIVMANIHRNVLVELMPKLSRCHGKILFSGLLIEDESIIRSASDSLNIDIANIVTKGEWISVLMENK